MGNDDLYRRAQVAIAELKSVIHERLRGADKDGLTNAQIGKSLGIYMGHEGHEGHVSRSLLALMQVEGTVVQVGSKGPWKLAEVSTD